MPRNTNLFCLCLSCLLSASEAFTQSNCITFFPFFTCFFFSISLLFLFLFPYCFYNICYTIPRTKSNHPAAYDRLDGHLSRTKSRLPSASRPRCTPLSPRRKRSSKRFTITKHRALMNCPFHKVTFFTWWAEKTTISGSKRAIPQPTRRALSLSVTSRFSTRASAACLSSSPRLPKQTRASSMSRISPMVNEKERKMKK